jgi:integrase
VFTTALGQPLDPTGAVYRTFRRLAEQSGLPRIRLHDLRHTSATLLLHAGVHPKVVQERLGHSTIQVTLDTYSHVAPSLQRDASEKIEALVRVEVRKSADNPLANR